MIRVVIAEDNKYDRRVLVKMLEQLNNIHILAISDRGEEILSLVQELKPQAVILDIGLPDITGLELAKQINKLDSGIFVIFVTSHKNYALEAFGICAFDYIVKPFDRDRLAQTFDRLQIMMSIPEKSEIVRLEAEDGSTAQKKDLKALIRSGESYRVIAFSDILMITRSARKTEIHLKDEVFYSSLSLEKLETLFKGTFLRSHKGFLINCECISSITPLGKKTYLVRFIDYPHTALLTYEKLSEVKKYFIGL